MTIVILLNVVLFFVMGIGALVRPHSAVAPVGLVPETVDARNEVRAVYGGFGIAIAVLLVVAAQDVQLRSGVMLAVAVALLGMAAGRVISLFVERPGKWPLIFLVVELVLGGLLLWDR
jgi:hypothetical protein